MRGRFLLASLTAGLLLTVGAAEPRTPVEASPSKGQVKIEIRFISVAEDFLERIGVDFNTNPPKSLGSANPGKDGKPENPSRLDTQQPILLNAEQTRQFMENLQGDVRTNVMQAPQMIVASGQRAIIRSSERRITPDGKSAGSAESGYEFCVRPLLASDRQTVALDLKLALSQCVSDTQGRLSTLSLKDKLILPVGHTAMVGGWKRIIEARNEFGPPVLSKIPYVSRLFKSVGYSRSTEKVLVMVTTSLVPEPEKPKDVPTLMRRYHDACAAGRLREAKQLARQALELDATCFDTSPRAGQPR